MSKVDDIITVESDELEQAELSDPLPKTVRVERRNEARSKVFSLRSVAKRWLVDMAGAPPER